MKTEKYLFQDFFRAVKGDFRKALEGTARSEYRLVKLKVETVKDLNRLKDETGQASLNDLITGKGKDCRIRDRCNFRKIGV